MQIDGVRVSLDPYMDWGFLFHSTIADGHNVRLFSLVKTTTMWVF